jgi:hypothetical protein
MDIYNPTQMPRSYFEIPEEFRKMCSKLSQDEHLPHFSSEEDFINFLTSDLDLRERKVVKAYFNSLLALNLTDRELLTVWREAGSDLLVSLDEEGIVREWFTVMASLIKTE